MQFLEAVLNTIVVNHSLSSGSLNVMH